MSLVLIFAVFSIAFFSLEVKWETKLPDVSYGLYIYGFFVQQAMVYLNIFTDTFLRFFAGSVIFTLILALPSYYFVEKPALELKKRIIW